MFLLIACRLDASPVVTSVNPTSGTAAGGTLVTVTGSGFSGATSVQFGASSATPTVIDDNTLTVTTPLNVFGAVDLRVTTGSGTSPVTRGDIFAYTGNWSYEYLFGTSNARLTSFSIPGGVQGPSVVAGFNPEDIAITPDGRYAVIPTEGTNQVIIMDLATMTPATTLSVSTPSSPQSVVISTDGLFAYVGSPGSPSIAVIDLTTHTLSSTVLTSPVNGRNLAITKDGTTLYVANSTSNNIYALNIASNTGSFVLNSAGSAPAVFSTPVALALSPINTTAYVPCFGTSTVVTFDTATNRVIGSPIALSLGPNDIAINSAGTKAYVSCNTAASLSVIDLATNEVTTPIVAYSAVPSAITLTPDGAFAYTFSPVESLNLTDFSLTRVSNIFGNNAAVITPDQAPVAAFTATASSASPLASFDASASLSPIGTVVSYLWDFGDSSSATTSTPTTTHTYAVAGNYTVTLTVTNSAGTSATQLFTGQTMSNNGNSFATDSQSITVGGSTPPSPPSSISKPASFKAKALTKKLKLHAKWKTVPGAVAYEVYSHSRKIETVTGHRFTKKLHPKPSLKAHRRKYQKWLHKKYKVRAVDASGNTSGFRKLKFKK